ncbi:MAG: HyaD/HybD family hydrogenase maturation endopeptidase [Candidatus Omnitrophota bacterium]
MFKKKITVLGIGNLLLKDEGIGIHVIEALKKESLPDNVELVDGAAAGFDLLPIVEACDKLIVIDAIKTSEEPGAIYQFDPRQIDIKRDANVSLHDVDFFHVLEYAKKYKQLPETLMIGIVPQDIELSLELSETLKTKIPKIVCLVKQEIEKTNSINM